MLKIIFVNSFPILFFFFFGCIHSFAQTENRITNEQQPLKSIQNNISKIKSYSKKQYKKIVKNNKDITSPAFLSDSLSFELAIKKNGIIPDIYSFLSTLDDTAFYNNIKNYIFTKQLYSKNDTSIKVSIALQYEKKKKNLGFSFNIPSYTLRDKTFSPLLYGGTAMGGTFFSIKTGCKSIRSSYTSFSYGSISSDISQRNFGHIHIDSQEDYYRLILNKQNKLNLYAGGLFETYFDFLFADIPTWTMAYSLNVSCLLNYRINQKSNVYFKTYTPFLAYSNRPAWGLFDDEVLDMSILNFLIRGKLASINTYRKLSYKIQYCYAFNKKINGFIGFDFHYLYVSDPLVLKSVYSKFQFGIMF